MVLRAARSGTSAAVSLALVLLSGAAQAGQVGGPALAEAWGRGTARVIVALREPDAPVAGLVAHNAVVERVQGDLLAGLSPAEFRVTHRWQSIPALAGEVTLAGLLRLMQDPHVLQVDLDEPAYMQSAEAAQLMRVDQVHGLGFTGKGIVVAVLDTGVDTDHVDLRDSLIAEACFCTAVAGGGCCPNGAISQLGPGAAEDDQGHGTNVAGVISSDGRVAPLGVAPDAQIVAIKVLDRGGSGTSAGILSGLDYVINSRPEVRVVNMSLGLANLFPGLCDSSASFTTSFASAINTLRARNVAVFAATANNANSSQIAVPACVRNAIAVGAVYDGEAGTVTFGCTDAVTQADQVACFSNSSGAVDLLAPGAPVTSTGLGGGLSTYLGTSQASPAAAGVAALLLEADPGLGVEALEAALRNTGRPLTDGRNGQTFGRVDARAAVDSVR